MNLGLWKAFKACRIVRSADRLGARSCMTG